MFEHIVRHFADAGLPLVLSPQPIVGVGGQGGDIVQIDIQRRFNGSRRREWFRLFPGAEDNRVEVVGADKKFGQVVLMVHEPAREFTEGVGWTTLRVIDTKVAGWQDVLAKRLGVQARAIRPNFSRNGKAIVGVDLVRQTSDSKRHMLMGLDESHLFVAQLPKGVSTIRDAHVALKRPELVAAEGKTGRAPRQGEFFFVPATEFEDRLIETGLSKNQLIMERTVPIGPFLADNLHGVAARGRNVRQARGNPHTVDELVVVPRQVGGTREVFVRGRIRHVDHKTRTFFHWMKVILNAEANQGQVRGVGWVD